jgi:hypothetical protein
LSLAGQVETYLPLHVGDSWTYVNDIGATRTFAVNAEREIDGRTYYEFDDYFTPCGFPGWSQEDDASHLFRHDPDSDTLLQYDLATAGDLVRYDFSGENWGAFGNQMIESGFDFSTPAESFGDCVRFTYATFVDCGVFHETVAPGVGTAGFYSSWDGEYRLQSYSVVPEPQISLALLCMIFIGTVTFCRRSAMILPTSSVSLAAEPSRRP